MFQILDQMFALIPSTTPLQRNSLVSQERNEGILILTVFSLIFYCVFNDENDEVGYES
jgi:hypothetical protein